MLEAIHSGEQTTSDLLRPVGVSGHCQTMAVGLVDHGIPLLLGHLVLIDQLDDIDTSLGEASDLGPGVFRTVDAPSK